MKKIYLPVREQKLLDALDEISKKTSPMKMSDIQAHQAHIGNGLSAQAIHRAMRRLRKEGFVRVVLPFGRKEKYCQGYKYELISSSSIKAHV